VRAQPEERPPACPASGLGRLSLERPPGGPLGGPPRGRRLRSAGLPGLARHALARAGAHDRGRGLRDHPRRPRGGRRPADRLRPRARRQLAELARVPAARGARATRDRRRPARLRQLADAAGEHLDLLLRAHPRPPARDARDRRGRRGGQLHGRLRRGRAGHQLSGARRAAGARVCGRDLEHYPRPAADDDDVPGVGGHQLGRARPQPHRGGAAAPAPRRPLTGDAPSLAPAPRRPAGDHAGVERSGVHAGPRRPARLRLHRSPGRDPLPDAAHVGARGHDRSGGRRRRVRAPDRGLAQGRLRRDRPRSDARATAVVQRLPDGVRERGGWWRFRGCERALARGRLGL
ncbi:MAG: hypothetical protein AVDCRST_MAG45-789, partial [uncultured Solirubrobacterales bacterium]